MPIQSLFSRQIQSSNDDIQHQAKVHCNSDCQLLLANEAEAWARIRELNWYGLSIDRVPISLFAKDQHPEIRCRWTMPREFGSLELKTQDYVTLEYHDPIGDQNFFTLEVNIPESELLENIRRYLIYRNKSFIRSIHRRNRPNASRFVLWGLWALIIILGLSLVFGQIKNLLGWSS
jgi:hypothetical protein